MTAESPTIIDVRIVRDTNNKDGWTARDRTRKVHFIRNLDTIIFDLEPGQIWSGELIEERDKYSIIELKAIVRR